MKKLSTPYRCTPSDARCTYRNGESVFFTAPHQKNLFLRHFATSANNLLSVQLICRTRALPGDWHRRINPDFLNITYINSGETFMRIEDYSFLAEEGDLILLPPGSNYEFGSSREAVRSGILLQGKLIESILQNLQGKYVFPNSEIMGIRSKIERFFQDQHSDEHELSVWSFDLLSSLKNDNAKLLIPPSLHKVITKMQKNIALPMKLEELAATAGVSPRTLSRMFTQYFQMPPHKYLMKLRMKRACQMLRWEEFSVKETAFAVGYNNALNFSTEFKRIVGFSPAQYRIQSDPEALAAEILPLRVTGDSEH